MLALTTALFAATLALLGKIGFDVWGRHRDRRSIASAIAGEIEAYIELLNGPETSAGYRLLATAGDRAGRIAMFRAVPNLPTSHPVFDKVADKIGLLPIAEAYGISRIYNVVTGMRLLISGMSSQGFIDASDHIQVHRMIFVSDTMEREVAAARALVARLKRVSRQNLWCWVGGCDP